MANERQYAGFTTQRAGPDSEEARLGWFERVGLEISDQYFVLFPAIVVDGGDEIAAQVLGTIEVGNLARPQLGRESEFGARHQPVREVIALRVVHEAIGGV